MHTGELSTEISKKSNRVPTQFTGCVSELSYRTRGFQGQGFHDYSAALKNYSEVYRCYHEYLNADDPVAGHDYALAVAETEEHSSLGLLGDDIEQSIRAHVHFSDEEIEQFGYLGWLQH